MSSVARCLSLRSSLLLTIFLCFLPSIGRTASITNIQANTTSVGLYDKYELTFDLNGVSPSSYNPFRPETTGDSLSPAGVDVWAQVTTPSGQVVKVLGFWDVDFDYLGQITDHGRGWIVYDRFVPASDPHWKIRYAPTQTGSYQVRLYATDQSGSISSSVYQFTCVQSSLKGFIRVASDGQRFTYSNGDPYIPMGMRVVDDVGMRETLLPQFKANGINFCRTWVVNGNRGDIHRELFPQSWTLTNAVKDTSAARTGDRSVKLSCPSGEAWETFVGVRNAANYRAAAWIKTSSDFNGTAAVQVSVRNSDDSIRTYTGNLVGGGSSWKQSVVNFSTNVSGKSAEFVDYRIKILSGSSGSAWVDDVELYEANSDGSVKYHYNYLWSPSFEPWNPSQLRIQPLWRLEYFLERGEKYDVAIEACIFDYRIWNTVSPLGFYTQSFGDFWSASDAIAQQNRVLRYLVARYSTYRSLFAWELTNEMDPSYTKAKADWISGRANFIKNNDPVKHMVDNSFWSSPGNAIYAQLPAIDLNEYHFYLNTEERAGGQGVSGWWNQPSGVVIDRTSSNAHSGSSSLKFTANGSTLVEYQFACLKPGHSYTVSDWVKTSSVTGSANAIIRIFGLDGTEVMSSITLSGSSGTSGYTKKQATFTASANTQRLSISLQLSGSSGTSWVDDVQVIDNSTGKNVFYNGGFEATNFGDDEVDWAVYNTFQIRQMEESGPNPTKKPFISGEFGLMGLNANLSAWADPTSSAPRRDTTGIHVHNCAWADFVATSALQTPSYWWVQQYIMPYNLTGVWKGIDPGLAIIAKIAGDSQPRPTACGQPRTAKRESGLGAHAERVAQGLRRGGAARDGTYRRPGARQRVPAGGNQGAPPGGGETPSGECPTRHRRGRGPDGELAIGPGVRKGQLVGQHVRDFRC